MFPKFLEQTKLANDWFKNKLDITNSVAQYFSFLKIIYKIYS